MGTILEELTLAVQLRQAGDYRHADEICRRILNTDPNVGDAWHLLGRSAYDQGQHAEAIKSLTRAAELLPHIPMVQRYLGLSYRALGQLETAEACYRRALAMNPEYLEVLLSLGNVLQDQERFADAEAAYRRCLQLNPQHAESFGNLGTVLRKQGALDEAVACYRKALELKPNSADFYYNQGNAFREQGKLDIAVASFRRALELKPDYADAHKNLGLTLLLAGAWQEGWHEYEWRFREKDFPPRPFFQPLWKGESLAGKTILLHAEQGLGDTLQFIRYAEIVKQSRGTVMVECQKPLLKLLEGCAGVDRWVGQGDALPVFDVHAPLLSVPGILKNTIETVPSNVPYLAPQPGLLEKWRARLNEFDGFKIGINWQGSPKYSNDRFRSIPLRHFAPLAQVPGVRLISLQKGFGSEQLAAVRDLFPITDFADELDQHTAPFLDTAAVMANLDLLITSDTATPHLAGALGVPVWVVLPFIPDWRWLLDREDSPWYPTMRLFRQKERANWAGVFAEIKQALCERIQASKA